MYVQYAHNILDSIPRALKFAKVAQVSPIL